MTSRIIALVTATAFGSVACSATPTRTSTPVEAGPPIRALVSCPGGTVRTAEQAAAFEGCESVDGDLRIEGTELFGLGAFATLTEVTGSLVIRNNERLISLAGFANLEHVRSLQLSENPRVCAKLGLFPRLAHVEEMSLTRNFGLSAADLDALHARVGQSRAVTVVALGSAEP